MCMYICVHVSMYICVYKYVHMTLRIICCHFLPFPLGPSGDLLPGLEATGGSYDAARTEPKTKAFYGVEFFEYVHSQISNK